MKRSTGRRSHEATPKGRRAITKRDAALDVAPTVLVGDICRMIDAARRQVATTVNTELTLLHWRIGARIRTEVLGAARAT